MLLYSKSACKFCAHAKKFLMDHRIKVTIVELDHLPSVDCEHAVNILSEITSQWEPPFLFIGGTTLVTESYTPSEKAKTQGLNDLMIFGTVALTAGISGVVHEIAGWQMLNLMVLPFLALVLLLIIWFSRVRQTEGVI